MGRPSKFTEKLAAEICQRLSAGESLRAICKGESMPPEATVRNWVVDDVQGFAAQYTRAREVGLDAMADELLDISDDGTNDWMQSNDPENPGYLINGEHSSRSKLRVDARKWYLSKIAPKKYGDRTAIEHSGKLGLESLIAGSNDESGK